MFSLFAADIRNFLMTFTVSALLVVGFFTNATGPNAGVGARLIAFTGLLACGANVAKLTGKIEGVLGLLLGALLGIFAGLLADYTSRGIEIQFILYGNVLTKDLLVYLGTPLAGGFIYAVCTHSRPLRN